MAVSHLLIFIVSTVLVISDSYYVTPVNKCYSRNTECIRDYFQAVVRTAARHGITEIDVPVLDPITISDYRASVPGWLDLELVEGVGEGLKTCAVNKFLLDFDKRYGSVELLCEVKVDGHYKIYSNSSLIRNLLNGDRIYGDGNGQIKFDKLKMSYDFDFNIEERGPDSFLNCNFQNSKFGIEVLGGTTFAADNLYLGQVESSQLIISLMNQYSKMILDATGLPVMDGFVKFVYDITGKYLYNTPLSSYVIDKITPYFFRW